METPFGSYDDTDRASIESHAQKLVGHTFQDVLDQCIVFYTKEKREKLLQIAGNDRSKGQLGNFIEEGFFNYSCNSDRNSDLANAGVEVKVSPYIDSNGQIRAKERLVLSMINYMEKGCTEFTESHVYQKCETMLLIYYRFVANTGRFGYRIGCAWLFSFPENDLPQIEEDYRLIQSMIEQGRAHELSGACTMYLEACPKAPTSRKRVSQRNNALMAKPRAYALKVSYMTGILRERLQPGSTGERILMGTTHVGLERHVLEVVRAHIGMTVEELCNKFGFSFEKAPKNLAAELAFRMLGVRGGKAQEFEKAHVQVKAIRLESNGRLKESVSFPAFKFVDVAAETWETSSLRNLFAETKFFFVIYCYDDSGDKGMNHLKLVGCQFWNMPWLDLENHAKPVWQRTKDAILHWPDKDSGLVGSFPKMSDDPVCHVRPHARNKADTCAMPNGAAFPKQCFWLRNTYIQNQLSKSYILHRKTC